MQEARKRPLTLETAILRNLNLPVMEAHRIARKARLPNRPEWVQELVAEGYLALVRAAHRYGEERLHRDTEDAFARYLRGAISHAQWNAIDRWRSGGVTKNSYAFKALRLLNEGVDLETISRETGLSLEALSDLRRLAAGMKYLDTPVDFDNEEESVLGDFVADSRPGPEEEVLDAMEAEERRRELQDALRQLPEHYRLAIALATGVRCLETVRLDDVLRANRDFNNLQGRGRQKLQAIFREGAADARRVGYEPEKAEGYEGRGRGRVSASLANYSKLAGQSDRRDRAEDIWRRIASRFQEAAQMGTHEHIGA